MNQNKDEFLRKLRYLLAEYHASISFECDDSSDTHGITGEKIVININKKPVFKVGGWWLDPRDMRERR